LHINQLRQDGFLLANITDGGEGVSGFKHRSESLLKMSNAKKGTILPACHKQKIATALTGRKQKRDHVEKVAAARKASNWKLTEDMRAKLSATGKGRAPWNKGIKANAEEVSRLKALWTDERKEKMKSTEYRAKMSLALRESWAVRKPSAPKIVLSS